MRRVTIATRGRRRLDSFIDDRPQGSRHLEANPAGEATLTPSIRIGARLEPVGYANLDDRAAVACYRGQIA
jgi:hypothetical protein